MGQIVYAAAMSHVLYPDYYDKNVGPHGRRMVEELIDVVRDMGRTMLGARPDALVVIADDHLNVFSFDAIPAMCVRIGRSVDRMVQEDAIEFDRALDGYRRDTRCTRTWPIGSWSRASSRASTSRRRGRRRSTMRS
jgi:hypothetical protein